MGTPCDRCFSDLGRACARGGEGSYIQQCTPPLHHSVLNSGIVFPQHMPLWYVTSCMDFFLLKNVVRHCCLLPSNHYYNGLLCNRHLILRLNNEPATGRLVFC